MSGEPRPQLALALAARDPAGFDNFLAGPNGTVVDTLRRLRGVPGEPVVLLCGPQDSGRTHLLQALCRAAAGRGQSAVHLPLAEGLPPEALEGLEGLGVVCLDDVDAVLGEPRWETTLEALLARRVEHAGGGLVLSAAAAALPIANAALAARLGRALVLALQPLDLASRRAALLARAERRGIRLPEAVTALLLRRVGDRLRDLIAALDALERALVEQPGKLGLTRVRAVLKEAGLP